MAGGLLDKRQQIGFKLESVEGTAESPGASDADVLVYGVQFELDIERNKREPARKYLTPLASVPGKQAAKVSFGLELKGSGALATAPSWGKVLKACKMQEAAVVTIAIGSVSGGPFRPGEQVVGGTSSAVGLVLDRGASTPLYLVVLSGTFQSGEVLTGSESAATATTSGTAAATKGWNYRPVSSGDSSGTCSFWHDGRLKKLYGCRGNVKGVLKNGGISMLMVELHGVYDATTDVAMPDPTHEATVPVGFVNVGCYLDTFQPEFAALEFDLGNKVDARESANATKGIRSFLVTGRAPTVTIDPEDCLVADFDFRSKHQGSSISYARCEVGSTPNRMVVAFPGLSYDAVKDAKRGEIATVALTLGCVSPAASRGDNEVLISQL